MKWLLYLDLTRLGSLLTNTFNLITASRNVS